MTGSMIPEAVFREFPAKNSQETPRFQPEPAGNSTQESGDRIRLLIMTGSGRNRINPVTGILLP